MIPVAAVSRGVLAGIVIVALFVFLGLIVVLTQLAERAGLVGTRRGKIPPGFRPGPSDEQLERRVLERYLMWGAVLTIFFAVFLPAYWLREPTRLGDKKEQFDEESIARGREMYGPIGTSLQAAGCAGCHGNEGEGGVRQFALPGSGDPPTLTTFAEPPLSYLVARYRVAGKGVDEIRQIVRDAIERGRPGTPMPTWGLAFGGPMHDQQVTDLVNFVLSEDFQKSAPEAGTADGKELFLANCAVCHNAPDPTGELERDDPRILARGGVGPNLTIEFQRNNADQIIAIIEEGRLNTNRPSMPSWAFLGEKAIRALVDFIESLQRVAS